MSICRAWTIGCAKCGHWVQFDPDIGLRAARRDLRGLVPSLQWHMAGRLVDGFDADAKWRN